MENSPIDKIADLITKAVLSHDNKMVSDVFVLFTGDMTARSEKGQFVKFNQFISRISNKLKDGLSINPAILMVPGNHDIKLKDRIVPIDDLYNSSQENKEALLEAEIPFMRDALDVCGKYGCFLNNKIVDIKNFEKEDVNLRFVLLNSSPFSTLDKKDKEHHFVSKNDLNLPKNYLYGKKTITILMSHHRPDWFDEETSSLLNEYINSEVSISFFGHEHNPNYEIKENSKGKIFCDAGGELIINKQLHNAVDGSFSFMYVKSNATIKRYTYKLNYKSNTFICDEPKEMRVRTNEILPLKEEFVADFFDCPLQNTKCTILDLFVMPSITNNKDNFELSTIPLFIEKLHQKREIIIEGSTKIGKTTLLKAVFNECQKSNPCIFLSIDNPTNDNAKKLVHDAFEKMYGDNKSDYQIFQSPLFNEKTIFVDNFNVLKDIRIKRAVLEYLRENFNYLVISNSKSDSPHESIKELDLFDENNVYRSYGLTARGRREITSKICKIKNIDERNIEAIYNLFEREINGVSIFDFTDPQQGMFLLEAIIDQKLYEERNTNKAFTETFKYQLDSMLVRNGKEQDLDSYVAVLMALSFNIWKHHDESTFAETEMMDAFKICKEEERCLIDYRSFQDTIINSGIIYRYSKDKYKFKRNSYLAYYIAQEIIRLNQCGDEEYCQELINKISYGINSDILLFILFYTKNIKPIIELSSILDKKYLDAKKLDFTDNTNILFSDQTSLPCESDENKVSKDEKVRRIDNKEKALAKEGAVAEIKQTSANAETNEEREIIETVKSIEIVSKAVSGFQTTMKLETRKQLFNSVYEVIHRMIGKIFNFKNNEIEQLEKEYDEYKEKKLLELSTDKEHNKKEIELLKNGSVRNFLYGLLIQILTLYESNVAYLIASKQTMTIINELESKRFENCVFKLYCYIFMSNFDKFIFELKYAKTHFPPNKINNLVSFFARIYIIHNSFKKEQFDMICSVSGIKKSDLLPYISREEKLLK